MIELCPLDYVRSPWERLRRYCFGIGRNQFEPYLRGCMKVTSSKSSGRPPVSVITTSQDGKITMITESAQRLFGVAALEVVNRANVSTLFQELGQQGHPAVDDRTGTLFDALVRIGTSSDAQSVDWRVARKDGSKATVNISVESLDGGGDESGGYVFVAQDSVFQKRAGEEREAILKCAQESARLESLGLLAGGVAHDFNNLLTGIMGWLQLVQLKETTCKETTRLLGQADNAVLKARDLCRHLLDHMRRGAGAKSVFDVNMLVHDAVSLMNCASKQIVFRFDLSPTPAYAEGEIVQFRQILLNLLVNASEAMNERRGNITISTRLVNGTERNVPAAGLCVELDVTDDGIGMTPEVKARIFEPFYTTKPTGTGIGLASVVRVIKENGGTVTVESAVGSGTSFRLLLPYRPPAVQSKPLARSGGRVLVIDDDDTLRVMIMEIMSLQGFQVAGALSGRKALQIACDGGVDYVCVLIDLTMPELDGVQTLLALRKAGLRCPVILMSGIVDHPALRQVDRTEYHSFMKKPATAATMITCVREAIASGNSALK
jgi:two-component system cell cycle sensor histidine kinase/response regulator CckA